jgi:hypothetical protein
LPAEGTDGQEAPNRSKYPNDYDSHSDYEVVKLGDMEKKITGLKK